MGVCDGGYNEYTSLLGMASDGSYETVRVIGVGRAMTKTRDSLAEIPRRRQPHIEQLPSTSPIAEMVAQKVANVAMRAAPRLQK